MTEALSRCRTNEPWLSLMIAHWWRSSWRTMLQVRENMVTNWLSFIFPLRVPIRLLTAMARNKVKLLVWWSWWGGLSTDWYKIYGWVSPVTKHLMTFSSKREFYRQWRIYFAKYNEKTGYIFGDSISWWRRIKGDKICLSWYKMLSNSSLFVSGGKRSWNHSWPALHVGAEKC